MTIRILSNLTQFTMQYFHDTTQILCLLVSHCTYSICRVKYHLPGRPKSNNISRYLYPTIDLCLVESELCEITICLQHNLFWAELLLHKASPIPLRTSTRTFVLHFIIYDVQYGNLSCSIKRTESSCVTQAPRDQSGARETLSTVREL